MKRSLFVIRKGKKWLLEMRISRYWHRPDFCWVDSKHRAMRFGELDGFLICQYLNYKEPGCFVLEPDDREDTAE